MTSVNGVSRRPAKANYKPLTWGNTVSEGGLEHANRCDLPGSGKSCNKSNTTGADAPGHSAACSLSRPLPGLYMAVRQVRASAPAPVTVAPSGTDSWAARAGPG